MSTDYPRQQPRYGNGTVTLHTTDRGEITIPEPAWCTGHDEQLVGTLAEVSHDGPPVAATVGHEDFGSVTLLRVALSHAPYLVLRPEPYPLAFVEGVDPASFDAAGLRQVAATVRAFCDRLDDVARHLDELAEGGAS